jgi:hypothetical protein
MEADISTWHKTGHFYFALTRAAARTLDTCIEIHPCRQAQSPVNAFF